MAMGAGVTHPRRLQLALPLYHTLSSKSDKEMTDAQENYGEETQPGRIKGKTGPQEGAVELAAELARVVLAELFDQEQGHLPVVRGLIGTQVVAGAVEREADRIAEVAAAFQHAAVFGAHHHLAAQRVGDIEQAIGREGQPARPAKLGSVAA